MRPHNDTIALVCIT